jgi:hypothetical protein
MGASAGTCSDCGANCELDNQLYPVGSVAVLEDGCTTCRCTMPGWECDASACQVVTCAQVEQRYTLELPASRWCGTQYGRFNCNELASSRLDCWCPVVVRGSVIVTSTRAEYVALGCPAGYEACPECEQFVPGPYTCGENGFCEGPNR